VSRRPTAARACRTPWPIAMRSRRPSPSPHTSPGFCRRPTRPIRSASSEPSALARCPVRLVCSEAIFSALSISEKAPEIASGQTGRVGFRTEPERRFEADRVGRLGRLAIPAVGRGFGCACRDVAVVCPGRLRAPVPPSLRTCGCGLRSVVHMHALRPAAFAERSAGLVSVGLAASASICMCGADFGLACRWACESYAASAEHMCQCLLYVPVASRWGSSLIS
jgi:hypothetical protein